MFNFGLEMNLRNQGTTGHNWMICLYKYVNSNYYKLRPRTTLINSVLLNRLFNFKHLNLLLDCIQFVL